MNLIAEEVARRITQVVEKPCDQYSQWITQEDRDAVSYAAAMDPGPNGPHVAQLVEDLKKLTGAPFVIPTISGTAALHLALMSLRRGLPRAVVMHAGTYVAAANVVRQMSEFVSTYYVDSCGDGNIDLTDVAGVVAGTYDPVVIHSHLLGNYAGDITKQIGTTLDLIEDCSQALGVASEWRDHHVGRAGLAGTLSFAANKIVTGGQGGALITDHLDIYERATVIARQGRGKIMGEAVGDNLRMSALSAALVCSQLARLPATIRQLGQVRQIWKCKFADMEEGDVRMLPVPRQTNYWAPVLMLPDRIARDVVHEILMGQGICTRPMWEPIYRLPAHYVPHVGQGVADDIAARGLILPTGPGLANRLGIV